MGLEKGGMECVGQVEIMEYALKVLKKHWPKVPKHTDILTFCVQDGLVKTIQSQAQERDTKVREAAYGQRLEESSEYLSLNGLSGKMFPDFSLLTLGKTSGKLYPTSIRSGIVWRGECWIPKTLVCPSVEKEYTLLEVLETSVHQKYYLSQKATEGLIRRAWRNKRNAHVLLLEMGKDMTPHLKRLSVRQLEHKSQGKERRDILQLRLAQNNGELIDKQLSLRKLTPQEKEQLQGFPKRWTLVEDC